MYVKRCFHLRDRNVIKKEAEKILKYKEIKRMCNVKNKSNQGNNMENWNLFKIIWKITEQLIAKARNRGTIGKSHT